MERKMNMKRLIQALVLVFAITMAMTACSSGGEYTDGVYRAEDASYNYGYKEFVEITIEKGKIAKVTADSIKEDGVTLKSQDAEYRKSYEGTGNNATPDVFYPSLAAMLEKKKDPAKVETVAGATNSSANFKRLSTAALENAKSGITDVVMLEPIAPQ